MPQTNQTQSSARIVTPQDDTATLKLIPLDKTEATLRLRKSSDPTHKSTATHRPIILKLSHVQNIDEEESGPSVVHARKFQDGSVAASVLLGRNERTAIKKTVVSRALCEISFSRRDSAMNKQNAESLVAYLSMRKAPNQHAVHIDGRVVTEPLGRTVPIKDGAMISLYGQCTYAYLVQIRNEDVSKSEEPPAKRRATSPSPKKPSASRDIQKRGHQLVVGEQTCSLCMEILIKTTFAVPCSHAFCSECTVQCNNVCPNCRGKVREWMPARAYDSMIWGTALLGLLDKNDAIAYLERRKENGEEDPTEEEKASILGETVPGNAKGCYIPSPAKNVAMTTMPPIYPQNSNGASNLFGNNLAVSAAASNGKTGNSADDAICLDTP